MSFLDGKPFVVTDEETKLAWSGGKNGKYFRCYLCGHKFKAGDVVRWQFTNDVPGAGGNPFVCDKCDGTKDEIATKWKTLHELASRNGKLWWFFRNDP